MPRFTRRSICWLRRNNRSSRSVGAMADGSVGRRTPGPPMPGPLDPVVLGPAPAPVDAPPLPPCVPGGGIGAEGETGADPGEAAPGVPGEPEVEDAPPEPEPDPPPWAIAAPPASNPARATVRARCLMASPRMFSGRQRASPATGSTAARLPG
ncbi:hypothetical protein GDR74_11270 [Microvirga thermotolerans]|uniref:Uncharacterized protein n=1 Tax=Microvirga thermotolerans TaxID=2651334 RepID=A0A5P9JVC1_9HYPH|nr:hypothetical protein GDR74_11270 [Microvirga thermotolerans]